MRNKIQMGEKFLSWSWKGEDNEKDDKNNPYNKQNLGMFGLSRGEKLGARRSWGF